jgi:TonB-dependent SusC/RagA subfamily outer membrane receptor
MKRIFVVLIAISLTFSLSAQQKVIYGKVNVFKNLTLSNIVVTAKKSGASTLTDSMGNYYIVCNPKDILEFTGKTFYKVRVRVKPTDDSIKVNMKFIDKTDNVEMAIGYGYISKENATTAVVGLTNSHENFCSYNDIYELISGKCAGVNVRKTGFLPGSEQEIEIRGINSINADGALYVVDGVETSQIANISPCDVKSISILKDSDAAIYGARGGGGVILIETVMAKDQ